MPELFARSNVFGTFKGFSEKGFEFAAEIVAPYNSSMLDRPQLGQFLLIELASKEEASLGRITKFVPSGLLASAEGEDYINTMQSRDQEVPEDLKKQKLKYKVQIKLLGAVKVVNKKVVFVPSQRRLPHLGAKVALPSTEVLKELCQLSEGHTDLGDYVLGEFVYSGKTIESDPVLRHIEPALKVTFNINNLVSKRSVVFARAGYGKSNLIKFLVAELYRNEIPRTDRGRKVGVLIFDADGEYFWPDFKNRPGLCDVEHLREHLVVFTSRPCPSKYYDSWKAGDVRIDIRDLPARDVIGISISADRQNQQNVIKLKSLDSSRWRELVDLIAKDGLAADETIVGRILGFSNNGNEHKAEIIAAKSNMNNVVNHLHDPNSQLLNGTLEALKNGYCVVVDISMLSSTAGNNVAGLLMRRIFNYNQEHFTGESPIPVISIIEEAQSVLGRNLEETSPFVEWVKEGRKYDLGALLVTQQPGSMSPQLLSQADNWFCFHLLSEGDAATLGKYNAHYSHDVLAHLISEPIQGNCYMWSAPKQPFVLPVRIRSFEELYSGFVNKDKDAEPFKKSAAIEIRRKAEQRNIDLANALHAKLLDNRDKLSCKAFPNDILGIYDGQLYVFIKQILESDEFKDEIRSENELKITLLQTLLDCKITIEKAEHAEKGMVNYYCAPKSNWEKLKTD
jgi:DNA helicase HerA-like ATPase